MVGFLISVASAAVALTAALAETVDDAHDMEGTVFYNSRLGSYSVSLGVVDCDLGVACGYFKDTLNKTGWGILEVATTSNEAVPDKVRMTAAGVLEGFLTSFEIRRNYDQQWANQKQRLGPYIQRINSWNIQQRSWAQAMAAKNPDDAYWQFSELLFCQFQGLQLGYQLAVEFFDDKTQLPPFKNSAFSFTFLSAHLEWVDVVKKLNASTRADWKSMSADEALNHHLMEGHCSAIVKVTPTLDNLFFSHNTWFDMWMLNKVYKMYYTPLQNRNLKADRISFSSYPGALSSIDDWYLMNSGVAVMETTNSVYNTELFDLLSPNSNYVWQRTRISSWIAETGEDWVQSIARFNNGCYNNQWQALTWKLFEEGKPLPDGLLMIAEQMPGLTAIEDVTKVLERGYWPSYNVPATKSVYQLGGTEAMAKAKGAEFSYDMCPRARLYRAYANQQNDLESLKEWMEYNNWQEDPLQEGWSNWAIAARFDLHPSPNGSPFLKGQTDVKLASIDDLRNGGVWIKAGPTYLQQPVFSWKDWESSDVNHDYLPEDYRFDWIYVKATL